MGQFSISACSSAAGTVMSLIVITGEEKDAPQIQMGRIPSECSREMTEYGRDWQGSAERREGMLLGIYTVTVKEDSVQVQVLYSILQK